MTIVVTGGAGYIGAHMAHSLLAAGERVVIVDDLLATGGTARAAGQLCQSLDGQVVGFAFVIELAALEGRKQLEGAEVVSLLQY